MEKDALNNIWELYKDKVKDIKSTQIIEDKDGNGIILCDEIKFWAMKFKNKDRKKIMEKLR